MSARMLVVTPSFHGYGTSIARGFEAIGYQVTVHEYDRLCSTAAKIRHKMLRELPAHLGMLDNDLVLASRRTVRVLEATRPDITVVIRGDAFSDDVHDALARYGGLRVLWLWDEVRRTQHTAESLDQYERHISYSATDASMLSAGGRPCLHVPNAFDHTLADVTPRPTPEVIFIGCSLPSREQALANLSATEVPVLAVGRDWSRHWFDRARTWRWSRPEVHGVRDVERSEGYAMTAGAPAAINIHAGQDGFTMRTFEVPGVGGVQLVDRPDVSRHYDPGTEVLTFSCQEELTDLARRCIQHPRWADRIREAGRRRTLAQHTFVHRARQVEQLWG